MDKKDKRQIIILVSFLNGNMNYIVFQNLPDLDRFMKRKISPKIEGRVEYSVMEKFSCNRILFTAEHAQTSRLEIEKSKRAYIGVGDLNTDIIAKIGAYYLRSAYIFPLFVRTEADASRPPEELGKGLRLFVKPSYSKQKIAYLPIHKNASMLTELNRYHEIIERLSPKGLISVHGISVKREFDMLFGFGDDYQAIGGKEKAFEFKHGFINYLDSIFRELGIKEGLKIAISKWRFTGSQNYVLNSHVIEHNYSRDAKIKRTGMQVELNFRGRSGNNSIPTIPYQIAIQALGDFTYKWMYGR